MMPLAFLCISLKIESAFGNTLSVEKSTFAPFEFAQVQLGLDLTAKGLNKSHGNSLRCMAPRLAPGQALAAKLHGHIAKVTCFTRLEAIVFYHWKGWLP